MKPEAVIVNGRSYRWPQTPLAVICCDGSEPAYMERAVQQGHMPCLTRMIAKGENLRGLSAMPSFQENGICSSWWFSRHCHFLTISHSCPKYPEQAFRV